MKRMLAAPAMLLLLTGCGPSPDPSTADRFSTAYNDYTTRAQVSEALARTADARIAISEYLLTNDHPPESLETVQVDPDLAHGATLRFADGVLHIHFDPRTAPAPLRDARIGIGLAADGRWYCGMASGAQAQWVGKHPAGHTTLPSALLPASCR